MGGQIAQNLALQLARYHVPVLGTHPTQIENAENRFHFSRMLDMLGVDQPRWRHCESVDHALQFSDQVGYPCLVRPSFVLSGQGMRVVHSAGELERFLTQGGVTVVSPEHHVVISKYIGNAKELDVDAVSARGELIAYALSEHVENAGVHSGDATLVLPARDVTACTATRVLECTRAIARELHINGPLNVQFIAKDDKIMVIECNVRCSRSVPFVCKTLDCDFVSLATRAMLHDATLVPLQPLQPLSDRVGVKTPLFSYGRLQGSDPVAGVEMASTGEVAGFGETHFEAYLKAMLASGFRLPKRTVLLSIGPYREKIEFLPYARALVDHFQYQLFATPGTADFLETNGVKVRVAEWSESGASIGEKSSSRDYFSGRDGEGGEEGDFSLARQLVEHRIDLAIMLPSRNRTLRPSSIFSRGYTARHMAVDCGVPLITNIKCAKLLVESMKQVSLPIPITTLDARSSRNLVRLPGLIDVHVHLREPGGTHKEDFSTGTAAALAGGFTLVCAMPNTHPPAVDKASFGEMQRLAREKARCDFGLYLGASSTNASLLPAIAEGAVALKMYLNQTYTTLRLDDTTIWTEHFQHWPRNRPLVVHAEGRSMAAALLIAALHPGRALHVAHISLREEILLIKRAKKSGLPVTCEVTPHHLFLSAEEAEKRGLGRRARVCPALASQKDVDALWENIDYIDHAPHTKEEKDSENPPPGFPGLETSLPLMLTAVRDGRLTMEQLVEKMYSNPKRIFGLPDQKDTYIEVDMSARYQIPVAPPHSRCQWTPFAGMEVCGRVERVVLRGQVAYLDGTCYAEPGTGLDVSRDIARPLQGVGDELSSVSPHVAATAVALDKHKTDSFSGGGIVPASGTAVAVGGRRNVLSSSPSLHGTASAASKSAMVGLDPSVSSNQVSLSPSSDMLLGSSRSSEYIDVERMTLRERLLRDQKRREALSNQMGQTTKNMESEGLDGSSFPDSSATFGADSSSDVYGGGVSLSSAARSSRLLGVRLPGNFSAKHIVSVKQFTRDNLRFLFAIAHEMRMMVKRVGTVDLLKGRVLANVFYEPSTRTSCSFAAAMMRLGGSVINVSGSTSSAKKGESLSDTIRTLECYTDCIVLRHPAVGAAKEAANAARRVPIINAGDGTGEHPTQALLDCFTIREERGSLNGITVTLLGDLKHGRTVHSLIQLLSLYRIRCLNYVSPSTLRMPSYLMKLMEKKGVVQHEFDSLHDVLPETDVLYVTRIQRERFASEEEYEEVKNSFIITPKVLSRAKETMVLLHPLPRVNEIDVATDADPRAAYFRQMESGMLCRMALLATVMGAI